LIDEKKVGKSVPKEEMTLKLSVTAIIKGMQLVESGRYKSFDQVIEEGITNLTNKKKSFVVKEIQEATIDYSVSQKETKSYSLSDLTYIDCQNLQTASAIEPVRLADKLLPITVQRLLPVKFCLRLLASELCKNNGGSINIKKFESEIFEKALAWRKYLEEMDASHNRPRGERLSSTFPASNNDLEKSNKRFFDSIVGYQYADGRLTGALLFLGFATVEGECSNLIRITDAGLRFVRLNNPIIDEKSNTFPPFNEEERNFLLNHFSERCPLEHSHTLYYLKVLKDHPGIGRGDLLRYMRSFYERTWNPLDLTPAMVDSLRACVNGRCVELGLAISKKAGKVASYNPTQLGIQWIESIEKKMKI
jgi:Arc/MetJ-type ribon-helix-helix transcriptional regulator